MKIYEIPDFNRINYLKIINALVQNYKKLFPGCNLLRVTSNIAKETQHIVSLTHTAA